MNTIIILIVLVMVLLLLLATTPGKVYLKDNNLRLQSVIGLYTKIPVKDITIMEMPKDAMNHMIRTFGTSIGKRHSGRFYNKSLKRNFNLYITGKTAGITYFEYKGKGYIVDSWN